MVVTDVLGAGREVLVTVVRGGTLVEVCGFEYTLPDFQLLLRLDLGATAGLEGLYELDRVELQEELGEEKLLPEEKLEEDLPDEDENELERPEDELPIPLCPKTERTINNSKIIAGNLKCFILIKEIKVFNLWFSWEDS